ncbi:MAG: DUF1992 domain-containing protein [Anaerolineae bacterium]|nr:DUF1992 domain-containing protein [Anaerolineae bacterium]
MSKGPLPEIDWGALVEEQIQEAMRKGVFDNLPGAGKPVHLPRNPYLSPDMEVAFKLLQDHGFAPEWIEADKDVRARVAKWRACLVREWESYTRAVAMCEQKPEPWRGIRRQQAEDAWQRRWSALQRELAQLNRDIDILNLKIPLAWLRRPRLDAQRELDKARMGARDEPED